MGSINPFIPIGFMLSVLAALAAFLITYEEWSHHYARKREPLRYAFEAAVVAFLVFAALTLLASVFVSQLTQH
jgi:polyferredoxin